MRGKLRREFVERVKTDIGSNFLADEVEDLIHEFCDAIETRLLNLYYELKRINGLTQIDAIRNTMEELVDDLW